MFEDLKKMSGQSKEMAKAAGQPTSMTGMLESPPDQINQASQMMDQAQALQADMARQQQVLMTGTPGWAGITGFTDTGMLVNYNPQVVLDLEVRLEDREPYAAQITTTVPQVYLARLTPGSEVAVKVDPGDPGSPVIDWAQP